MSQNLTTQMYFFFYNTILYSLFSPVIPNAHSKMSAVLSISLIYIKIGKVIQQSTPYKDSGSWSRN